jgi:dTDP-glucose pyrophosphorylase
LAANDGSAQGATVFAYPVSDPKRYGMEVSDAEAYATSLEEKTAQPKFRYDLSVMYSHYKTLAERAERAQQPSTRGELEITEFNSQYLDDRCSMWITWSSIRASRHALHEAASSILLARDCDQRNGKMIR